MDSIKAFFSKLWNDILSSTEVTVQWLPKLAGILVIVFLGWLAARILSKIVKKILKKSKAEDWLENAGLADVLQKSGMSLSVAEVGAKITYWFVLFIMFMTLADQLGMEALSEKVSAVIGKIPTVLGAIALFLIGAYLARLVRDLLKGTTASFGIGAGKIVSSFIYYLLMVLVTITALNQGGINTDIITDNVKIIMGSVLLAASISYGFASRKLLANILASYFGRKTFKIGDKIEIDGITGTVTDITSIAIVILLDNNDKMIIPSSRIMQTKIRVKS